MNYDALSPQFTIRFQKLICVFACTAQSTDATNNVRKASVHYNWLWSLATVHLLNLHVYYIV